MARNGRICKSNRPSLPRRKIFYPLWSSDKRRDTQLCSRRV